MDDAKVHLTRPLPGALSATRPPRAGDLYVLLASSDPVPPAAAARIAELRGWVGGRHVEPLHITCDRIEARGDEAALVELFARDAATARPVPVRATSLLRLRRRSGGYVLKLVIEETAELTRIRAAVGHARSVASVTTSYGHDVTFTVSILEDIRDGELPEVIAPFEAFRADRYLFSRFLDDGRYETVRSFDFTVHA